MGNTLERFAVMLDDDRDETFPSIKGGYFVEARSWFEDGWRIDVWRKEDGGRRLMEHGPDPVVTIRGLSRNEISRLARDLTDIFGADIIDGQCTCPACGEPRCGTCPEYEHCALDEKRVATGGE